MRCRDIAFFQGSTKTNVRTTLLSLALVAASSTHAFADVHKGKVLAYDRVAQLLVMQDKTVFTLEEYKGEIPADLKAGDAIQVDSAGGGEDGYGKITAIKKL